MNNKLAPIVIALILILGGFLFIFSLGNEDNDSFVTQSDNVFKVSSQEFDQLAQQEDAFILDVHTPEQTHIPDTNAFIPFDQIDDNLDKLPEDKSTPILVYCRSGSMSDQASQEIAELGYTQVYDLEGGLNSYREQRSQVTLWPEFQDLGKVIYGDVVNTEFTLTNLTPLSIKITRISTSCGCTSAQAEQQEIGPYDATAINVSFDPAVHKDDTDLGELTRTIYIETDHPNFNELSVSIKANVIKDL